MPTAIDKIDHNARLRTRGTGTILAAIGALSADDAQSQGYRSYGNVSEVTYEAPIEITRTSSHIQGITLPDRTYSRQTDRYYTFKANEILRDMLLQTSFQANPNAAVTDNARGAISAAGGTALTFGASSNPHEVWLPLKDSAGQAANDLTAVTFEGTQSQYGSTSDSTTLEEGVDYDVDVRLGMYRLLRRYATGDTITPTLTGAAITSQSTNYRQTYDPQQQNLYRGMFRVYIFDEDHEENYALAEIDLLGAAYIDGSVNLANDNEVEVTVKLLVERAGTLMRNVRR